MLVKTEKELLEHTQLPHSHAYRSPDITLLQLDEALFQVEEKHTRKDRFNTFKSTVVFMYVKVVYAQSIVAQPENFRL
jgi:hypothetical protein